MNVCLPPESTRLERSPTKLGGPSGRSPAQNPDFPDEAKIEDDCSVTLSRSCAELGDSQHRLSSELASGCKAFDPLAAAANGFRCPHSLC